MVPITTIRTANNADMNAFRLMMMHVQLSSVSNDELNTCTCRAALVFQSSPHAYSNGGHIAHELLLAAWSSLAFLLSMHMQYNARTHLCQIVCSLRPGRLRLGHMPGPCASTRFWLQVRLPAAGLA